MKELTELKKKYEELKNDFSYIIELVTEQGDVQDFIFEYCEDLDHLEKIYNIIKNHEITETYLQQVLKEEIEKRREEIKANEEPYDHIV
jgi:predicted RNA binding protein with dsRBD fold (UPF0201 family)